MDTAAATQIAVMKDKMVAHIATNTNKIMTIEKIQKELRRLQIELNKLNQENLYIPQPGEVVLVDDSGDDFQPRIFITYSKCSPFPFVCVAKDDEQEYKNGKNHETVTWKLCRRLNGEIVEFGCDKPKQPDYTHLLPDGYEFCDKEQAEKWVKVERLGVNWEAPLGEIYSDLDLVAPKIRKTYRPIRKIKPEPNPYEVDWSNAPKWADSHAFDQDGTGYWYGTTIGRWGWTPFAKKSPFTLPSGLDWKQSKTLRPR